MLKLSAVVVICEKAEYGDGFLLRKSKGVRWRGLPHAEATANALGTMKERAL